MNTELQQLRRQINHMRWYMMISSAIISVFIIAAFTGPKQKLGIIRAKGIVIEDSAGNDRILIGAPI
jgi:hypothetical protein